MSRARGSSAWIWASEAMVWLGFASLVLRLMPFATATKLAGRPLRAPPPNEATKTEFSAKARRAVLAAARRAPWRAVCIHRGLAVQIMLRRRGVDSRLCYGVRPDDSEGLAAHVWVRLDGRSVIGGEGAERFAILAEFPSQNPARGG